MKDALKDLSVLYVEDNESVREQILFTFTNLVKQVWVAENGLIGKELFFEHHPDLIVTDIQMPVKDGLEMLEEIKSVYPEAISIVITAFNDTEYLFQAIELGVNHYLTKPVDLTKLLQQMRAISDQLGLKKKLVWQNRLLEQYKEMIDSASIICKFDKQGCITFVNTNFTDSTGYSVEEALENTMAILWKDPDSDTTFEECLTSINTHMGWRGMIEGKNKSNNRLMIDTYIIPLPDIDGEVDEYMLMALDVTELYQYREFLEVELDSQNLQLQATMNYLNQYRDALNLSTAICIIDLDGNIQDSNAAFQNILFYSEKELLNRHYSSLFFGKNESIESVIFQLNDANIHKTQNYMSTGNQLIKIMQTTYIPLRDMEHSIEKIICIHFDVTELVNLNDEIIKSQYDILMALGAAAEKKSKETGQHVKRVASYSRFLAEKIGLTPEQCTLIQMAAPMHDIGKIAIPEYILHKPGSLDREERHLMNTHALSGYEILNHSERPLMKMAATIALQHHEHYDGNGYPNGLVREEIDISARIVAIADVFDSLSNARAYKAAWKQSEVIKFLNEQRGKQFDPVLVDVLIKHIDEINEVTACINEENTCC